MEPTTATAQLYRVMYTTSGLRRRSKTVTKADLDYLSSAWHAGIRVTSYRRATDAETTRGAWSGSFNR